MWTPAIATERRNEIERNVDTRNCDGKAKGVETWKWKGGNGKVWTLTILIHELYSLFVGGRGFWTGSDDNGFRRNISA